MAYPYIWSFSGSTNIEVFVSSNDVSYGVYKSYIMIEEFEKHEFLIGRDRITDPTNVSKVQVTDQYIDFNVNNTDYAKFTNNSLVL